MHVLARLCVCVHATEAFLWVCDGIQVVIYKVCDYLYIKLYIILYMSSASMCGMSKTDV